MFCHAPSCCSVCVLRFVSWSTIRDPEISPACCVPAIPQLTLLLIKVVESRPDSVRVPAEKHFLGFRVEEAEVEDAIQLRRHEVDSSAVVQMDESLAIAVW